MSYENWSERKFVLIEKHTVKTRRFAKRTWKIRPKKIPLYKGTVLEDLVFLKL